MIRRLRSPLLLSAAAHVLAFIGLVQLFAMPNPLRKWLERERVEFQAERIGYISLPATAPVSSSGRRGGDNRPVSDAPAIKPAPTMASVPGAPVVAATVPPASEAVNEGGSGPLVGGGGPLKGVQPAFHDPRLWTIPDRMVTAPRSSADRIDSVFAQRVARARDSLSRVPGSEAPEDWSIGSGSSKYGVTKDGIVLAGVTIPIVPFRPPPGKMDEARRLFAMRTEMMQQSQRRLNEDEFRQAAQRIRERKDRERELQQQERQKEKAAPIGGSN